MKKMFALNIRIVFAQGIQKSREDESQHAIEHDFR